LLPSANGAGLAGQRTLRFLIFRATPNVAAVALPMAGTIFHCFSFQCCIFGDIELDSEKLAQGLGYIAHTSTLSNYFFAWENSIWVEPFASP